MTLKAKAYLPAAGVDPYSDVESVQYQEGALVVVLACSLNEKRNIEGFRITFPSATGFRLLDELDLARYWLSTEFTRGSYLLEVTDGGWAAEETELQGYESPRREWLALTGNSCVNVFCTTEPLVTEVSWPFEGA